MVSLDVQNEPHIALDGGNDGLEFYKRISNQVDNYLSDNGYLVLEIGYDQGKEVCELFDDSNFYKDLNNNDRCVIYQKDR